MAPVLGELRESGGGQVKRSEGTTDALPSHAFPAGAEESPGVPPCLAQELPN